MKKKETDGAKAVQEMSDEAIDSNYRLKQMEYNICFAITIISILISLIFIWTN